MLSSKSKMEPVELPLVVFFAVADLVKACFLGTFLAASGVAFFAEEEAEDASF